MSESRDIIASLRRRIGAIEGMKPCAGGDLFALGDMLDARLDGGLPRGRLHELFAATETDQAAVAGFALMLAIRIGGGPILWLRQDGAVRAAGHVHAAGMVELGFDPARLIEVVVPDEVALLRAAGDAVRCPEVAMVLIEPWKAARAIDLTASRRLAIAAEASGVTVLMLRGQADPAPSAAYSRWQIRGAAAVPLEGDAPGHATIEVALLRHRRGLAEFRICLEWDRDQRCFREPALSGALVSFPADRSPAPDVIRLIA
jgi:protein ImuA